MKRFFLLFTVLVFFLWHPALAATNTCRIDIDGDGSATVTYALHPAANAVVSLRLLQEPERIEVRTSTGLLPYNYSNKLLSTLSTSGEPMTIRYTSKAVVSTTDNVHTITFHPHFSNDIIYSVMLPERAEVLSRNSTIPTRVIEEGRNKVLNFENPSGTLVIIYRLGGEMAIALPFIYLFFALGWVGYMFAITRSYGEVTVEEEEAAKGGLDAVLKTLDDTEKAIVQELLKSDGELLQTTIRQRLQLGKYPLSRALERLERKKVVIKERVGKVNRIRMSRWLLEDRDR